VFIRVIDADRSRDENSLDTVFIDHMFIRAEVVGPVLPTVSIVATDPNAAEAGLDPGLFTVSRTGDTTDILEVFYAVSGDAIADSDYTALSGNVTIDAGASSVTIDVAPLDDLLAEGTETVTVTISSDPSYHVSVANSDSVSIADDDLSEVNDFAFNESTTRGNVDGTFAETHESDNTYESITEELYAGNRRSQLEHQWVFDVTGGSEVIFHVEAHHNSTVEDFVFEYSTDGSTWITMLTVKNSDEDTAQTFVLPASTSGTVFVRVRDTDRSHNESVTDTIFIDEMFIRSLT
jgi:hypothetical protein